MVRSSRWTWFDLLSTSFVIFAWHSLSSNLKFSSFFFLHAFVVLLVTYMLLLSVFHFGYYTYIFDDGWGMILPTKKKQKKNNLNNNISFSCFMDRLVPWQTWRFLISSFSFSLVRRRSHIFYFFFFLFIYDSWSS